MNIKKSEKFKKQVSDLEENYQSVYKDVEDLERELTSLAFKRLSNTNYCLCEIEVAKGIIKEIWRIKIGCSDNNQGKSSGYRVFYCKLKPDSGVFLLGIFIKKDIEGDDYREIAKHLIKASKESILANN